MDSYEKNVAILQIRFMVFCEQIVTATIGNQVHQVTLGDIMPDFLKWISVTEKISSILEKSGSHLTFSGVPQSTGDTRNIQ